MKKPSSSKIIVTVGLVFLLAGLWWKTEWPVYTAACLFFITLISDYLTEKLAWLWMKLGHVLGYINSRIILGIIFIFILNPIAFFYRLFRKDSLQLKRKKEGSYYHSREHIYAPKDMEQMW